MSTAGWLKARSTVELRGFSGNLHMQLGYETTVDQMSIGTPTAFGDSKP